MNTATHYYFAGMGQSGSQQRPSTGLVVAATAAGAGTAATQIINGHYLSGVGTALLTAAMVPGNPAAPFLAVAGAVAEILGAIGIGAGCGQTCIVASEYANQAESLLRQNLNTYMGLPVPRAQSAQIAALNIFDTIWAGLTSVQACGNPALGDAGKRCISDRQRGACHYQNNGQCWNWFVGYRDPIANDPTVPDTVASSSSIVNAIPGLTEASAAIGLDPTLLLALAAFGVAVVVGLS